LIGVELKDNKGRKFGHEPKKGGKTGHLRGKKGHFNK